jgi:phosphatase NudJ
MPRDPIPAWFFIKVIVRKDDRFLLVQECRYDQAWHLPAGRVEPGETFVAAALRETVEETAVPVVLDGILRIEHSPQPDKAYMGVIFLAHPVAGVPPKCVPDDESLRAAWFTLEEAEKVPLREPEVLDVLRYVRDGGPVYPLTVIARERWAEA